MPRGGSWCQQAEVFARVRTHQLARDEYQALHAALLRGVGHHAHGDLVHQPAVLHAFPARRHAVTATMPAIGSRGVDQAQAQTY